MTVRRRLENGVETVIAPFPLVLNRQQQRA